jgi:hypothetical protein
VRVFPTRQRRRSLIIMNGRRVRLSHHDACKTIAARQNKNIIDSRAFYSRVCDVHVLHKQDSRTYDCRAHAACQSQLSQLVQFPSDCTIAISMHMSPLFDRAVPNEIICICNPSVTLTRPCQFEIYFRLPTLWKSYQSFEHTHCLQCESAAIDSESKYISIQE